MQIDENFMGQPLGRGQSARESIQRLGTLGDDPIGLTCSMDVARRWGCARTIEPFSSFEKASHAVKQGHVDAFLVPGAYPSLNAFIMDSALMASDTFVMAIPSLVLCVAANATVQNVQYIFHHPATTALLPEVEILWKEAVHASSNVEACRNLLDSPENSACVTNLLCANHFNLKIIQTLRQGISMPWICFKKLSAEKNQ